MPMANARYYFLASLILLITVWLFPGAAGGQGRLPVPQTQVKTLPPSVTPKPVPSAYPPPKGIAVSGTLSAVGPRIDTSQMQFDPPKTINVQNSLAAVGPRIDTSGMTFDPPKGISVATPLTAVGPR